MPATEKIPGREAPLLSVENEDTKQGKFAISYDYERPVEKNTIKRSQNKNSSDDFWGDDTPEDSENFEGMFGIGGALAPNSLTSSDWDEVVVIFYSGRVLFLTPNHTISRAILRACCHWPGLEIRCCATEEGSRVPGAPWVRATDVEDEEDSTDQAQAHHIMLAGGTESGSEIGTDVSNKLSSSSSSSKG